MGTVMMTEIRVKGETDHQILPREELGRLLAAGQVEGVFKYGLSERKEPADDVTKAIYNTGHAGLRSNRPTASAVITASTVDRDGDIVRADGLDVKHYLKNPIVLPMHTLSADVYPVAMTERLKQTHASWWAKFQWLVDLDATAKRAAEYMQLWDAGVLNCTSIGFIPTKWEPIKDGGGYDFQNSELLEFSTVFIPSQRDALRTEGMKHFLDVAGELITAGPSPLMKGWLVAKEAEGRPKQVAVGVAPVGECVTGDVCDKCHAVSDEPGSGDPNCNHVWRAPKVGTGMVVAYTEEPAAKVEPIPEKAEAGGAVYDDAEARKIVARVKEYMDLAYLKNYRVSMGVLVGVAEGKPCGCFRTYAPRDAWTLAISVNGGGTQLDRDGDADFREATWDEVRLACAAGALPVEQAFQAIERLMSELESGADAARADAESWKTRCAALSARVVKRYGGDRDGDERARSH